MAKRTKVRKSGKSAIKFDETKIEYMYLITRTAKGREEKPSVLLDEMREVTKLVRVELGGTCDLFSVQGSFDYVSVVKAVPAVGAIQIWKLIETGGNRKAIMLPAYRVIEK